MHDKPLEIASRNFVERRMDGAHAWEDDFERLRLHEILRALVNQLHALSRLNVGFSKLEQSGGTLSTAENAERSSNRVLMGHIERLIQKHVKGIALAA